MSKMTQKEMLLEGFLDAVRASARTLSKGAVKAVGGTVGATLGATKNIARDLVKADVNANPFSSIASGAVQGAKTGSDLASKGVTAITGKEEAALRQELETNYRDVFQTISINIRRGQPDPTNMNITIIPFTARRLGDPTILKPDSNIATGNTLSVDPTGTLLQNPLISKIVNTALGTEFSSGGKQPRSATLGLDTKETGELKGRFNSPITKFLTDLKNSNQGLFFGYVKKTGDVKSPYIITVRDITGAEIPKRSSKRQPPKNISTQPAVEDKPKFYESLRAWKIKNIGPSAEKVGLTYQQLKQFLQSINVQDPDRVLKNAGAKDSGAAVSNIILSNIESTLKGRGIVAEKAQINLIKQLKNLNDSYNKKYELPKH